MKLRTKAGRSPQPNQRELDNLQVAYQAACEGIVLLKNDGTLPLQNKKIALYGAGASMTVKGGTGSGEVNERHSVSALEGLQDRGFEVTTGVWLAGFNAEYRYCRAEYMRQKRRRVNLLKTSSVMDMLFDDFQYPVGPPITLGDVKESETDCCIYVLSRQAGEGGDRRAEKGDLYLTRAEEKAIRFCAEHYEKFVLVINCGSAMDVSFLESIPGINALVYICQLGTQGGYALADVLSGAVPPSGKLADTWAKSYDDIPFAREFSYLNNDADNEYYKEGIYVGYRYFDSFGVAPAFPFGFGLSYTDFSLSADAVEVMGSQATVKVTASNLGDLYPGKEVAQLYVSSPAGQLHKEYQSLAAFEKSQLLQPGQQQQLELSFDLRELASFRETDNCFVLEAGEYILRLGNSSRNTKVIGVLTLSQEVTVSRHQPVCPLKKPLQELKAPAGAQEDTAGVYRMAVDPAAFVAEEYTYQTPDVSNDPAVTAFLDTLRPEEMAEIVVGIGMFGGKTGFTLPGAVGNTTSRFWDRGLANVTLCDGPAGLRIQKISTVTDKGRVKPVEMAMSVYEMMPGFLKRWITGDPEKETPLYQYTTAFPVATALAQSWNKELLKQVGQAIQREMEEYGCTYWLAPAVNIHRNVLCGRNFEYYSEDPVLAGTMAAAVTKGVQEKPGYYVTVKHFACNNQEENRNFSDSCLSQRTLREIYLRPFRQAVKVGAKGIMTSYNKVNGVYTPNSYDLCTKVLRNEWGFEGVVMTDWFSTRKGQAEDALCMAAGNDLIMPGTARSKKQILKGLKKGWISEEDLRRCCANVIKAILESNIQREYMGQKAFQKQ